jgi:pimeloyl-ACP methyl ester carboxylesterase
MPAERALERNGRRLAWREMGEGPVLLLLQGYSGTAADWDPTLLGELAAGHRVLCPDPRGMGSSSWGDDAEALTVGSMADDALAVLDAVGAAHALVVGWSMGGFVAQALTGLAPARVRGLALIGTDAGGPDAVRAAPADWARLVDASGTPRQQATRLLELLFPQPLAAQLDAQVGDLVAQAKAVLDPAVLRAQEVAIVAWHTAAPVTVPAGSPPVVAVAGADDVVIPAANLALLAARWPGCRTEVVEGAGHGVMAQEPQRVAALVSSLA